MLQLTTIAAPTPTLPHLPASDRAQPPSPGYKYALLMQRSGTSFSSDNAYSSLDAAAKPSEPPAAAASTAMERTIINADSDDEDEAVTLRRYFFNTGRGRFWGRRL